MKPSPKPSLEVVDPRWILKAIAFVVLAALICGYLTLSLLFYQGQWQLIVHPTLGGPSLPNPIRFDAAETGSPRLSGSLLPAPEASPYGALTVLYLRGGDASLAVDPADTRNLAALNALGLTVFAFDYRGYGQSDPTHPNHLRMTEDSGAALRYLTETRAIPESHILLYGTGLGTSLATYLAATHPHIPALILDSPAPSTLATALADPRTRALPVRALFHEDFPLTPLTTLTTPKLLISHPTPTQPMPPSFSTAADYKTTLELQPNDDAPKFTAIRRFLDQILPTGIRKI